MKKDQRRRDREPQDRPDAAKPVNPLEQIIENAAAIADRAGLTGEDRELVLPTHPAPFSTPRPLCRGAFI